MNLIFTFALTFVSLSAFAGQDRGGGSQCLLKMQAIKEVLIKAAPRFKSLKSANISNEEFVTILAKTSFEIEKNLKLENKYVDAINYPSEIAPLIVVDYDRCDDLLANLEDGMAFLVHEVMGLMKKETREDYSISKNVLNELKDIVVKQSSIDWKYACSVRRWHYTGRTGYAGYEYLGTVDSYGGSIRGPGYLYSRSSKELEDYAVDLSISRGIFGKEEPKLMYTFIKDPKHQHKERQYIVPAWTEVPFESGKAVVRLLGPEAFQKNEGMNTSSHVEMVCYRSI